MSLYPLLSDVDRTPDAINKLLRSNDQFYSGLKTFQRLLGHGHMDPEYMARSRAKRRRRDHTKVLENEGTYSSTISSDTNSQANMEVLSQLQPEIPVTISQTKDGEEPNVTDKGSTTNVVDLEIEENNNESETGNSIFSPPPASVTPSLPESVKPFPSPPPDSDTFALSKIELESLDKSVVEFRNKLKS